MCGHYSVVLTKSHAWLDKYCRSLPAVVSAAGVWETDAGPVWLAGPLQPVAESAWAPAGRQGKLTISSPGWHVHAL